MPYDALLQTLSSHGIRHASDRARGPPRIEFDTEMLKRQNYPCSIIRGRRGTLASVNREDGK